MPLPREMLEEFGRKRREESRLADRDRILDLTFTVLRCWFWAAAGLACIAWSLHTTLMWLGKAAFWTGLGMGNAGIAFSLLGAYRRGERRAIGRHLRDVALVAWRRWRLCCGTERADLVYEVEAPPAPRGN